MYEDRKELDVLEERARVLEQAIKNFRLAVISRDTALQYGSSFEKQKTLVNLIEARDQWKKTLLKENITEAEYQLAISSWTGKKAKDLLAKAMRILRSLE